MDLGVITKNKNIIFLILPFLLSACIQRVASADIPVVANLNGGILATFKVQDQQFRVWVKNPDTIQQILDLQAGKSNANIPEGRLLLGPGENNYNQPYSWHLDPENIQMKTKSVEASCNVDPETVDRSVKKFINDIGRYCPSKAVLVNIQDYREPLPGLQTAMILH